MSWGTSYRYDGYLSHIGKDDISREIRETEQANNELWREILAYMAMTPPVYAEDCEGEKYPWAEHIAAKMREYRERIEENTMMLARLADCEEAMKENPQYVTEG